MLKEHHLRIFKKFPIENQKISKKKNVKYELKEKLFKIEFSRGP